LLALAAFVLARFARVRRTAGRLWRRVGHGRPAVARLRDNVEQTVGKALAAYPDAGGWARPFSAALSNWVCDAVALALCLWSLGIPVPWRGFLMAYALTQVLSSLRVTPGSLGVAEASLSGLLVLYGLPADQAIAATLLYRILGFWVLQPIGWASWLVLTLHDPQLTRGADGRPPAASP
jgi:uncharacterized protein (TIRG00374 family)